MWVYLANDGISQAPSPVESAKPNKVIQDSAGNGGGSSLKFAVNLPNVEIPRVTSGSSGFKLNKSSLDLKGVVGFETFIICVTFEPISSS